MTSKDWAALGVGLATAMATATASPPVATIANGPLRATVYLPDTQTGFYRGTRFDWSGVIGDLEFAGHTYYPQWFQRNDPQVHDFIYDGTDIVAGPCTAVTGPAEEFSTEGKGLGFDEAKAGGTFIKIGVGILRRPDDRPYDPFHLYELVDPGKWTVSQRPDAVEFVQTIEDTATGYAYEYRKTVSLDGQESRLVLDHRLRNTGRRVIRSSVYNHNFLYLDHQPPGPDTTLTFPFRLKLEGSPKPGLAIVQDQSITFAKELTGEDRVYLALGGFGPESSDYDIRVDNRKLGVGVRITADRPMSRLALWAIRAPLSIEPFIDMAIQSGAEFTWRIDYHYYRLAGAER